MEQNKSLVSKSLSWAYDKAVNGLEINGNKVLDSAYDLAKTYSKSGKSIRQNATTLINWQCSKSAISGFSTGFGGWATALATLPANLTSVLFIQLRMIAAIAVMAGYDIRNDKVQTLAYACLMGNSAEEAMKGIGIKVGEKWTKRYIDTHIRRDALKKINNVVGSRFITKNGSKGMINLTKAVPVVGGLVGAAFDAGSTKIIGSVAKNLFIDGKV